MPIIQRKPTTDGLQYLRSRSAGTDEPMTVLMGPDAEQTFITAGTVICAEGEMPERWWLILDGTAEIHVGGRTQREVGAGESIGAMAAIDGRRHTTSATAMTDMVALTGTAVELLDRLADHPELVRRLILGIFGRTLGAGS